VDGNFKANHVWQISPADDVWLSDGLGMTTTNSEYSNFLETAWDHTTVSLKSHIYICWKWLNFLIQKVPCEINFKAIENALLFSKACNITGIVACACAQHGCFAPNSIVNCFEENNRRMWIGPCWKHFGLLKCIQSRA